MLKQLDGVLGLPVLQIGHGELVLRSESIRMNFCKHIVSHMDHMLKPIHSVIGLPS